MSDRWWSDDEQLLSQLDDAISTAREVPDHFIELGKGAFAWRSIDAELAELAAVAYDSAAPGEGRAPVGARGEPPPVRTMTFATSQLTIEIEVAADALRGQLVPPQPGEIHVRDVHGSILTDVADEVGWFVLSPIPDHPFQLLFRTETGQPVRTDWIIL